MSKYIHINNTDDTPGIFQFALLQDIYRTPIAYLDTPYNDFTVNYHTDYPVPFTNEKFPSILEICEVKLAVPGDLTCWIKPLVEGFYHVDGLFRDTGMTTPNAAILKIGGGDGLEEVDYVGAPLFYLQGSRIVYCDGVNDVIDLEFNHGVFPNAMFNKLTVPGANGYICVHYCGFPNSATP